MAISSYKVYLMTSSNGVDFTKLVDVKDFPDLGAAPAQIEVTTLSDPARCYIPGIEDTDQKTLTANYTSADYETIAALKGTEKYVAIWFGEAGADGKFTGKAYIDVFVTGAGVNEAVNMTITLTMTVNFVKGATISG